MTGYIPLRKCVRRYADENLVGLNILCSLKGEIRCGRDLAVICRSIDHEGHLTPIENKDELPSFCRNRLEVRR